MSLPKIVSFDLETTSPDPTAARIVTYAALIMDERGEVVRSVTGLVNPGVEIPEGAAAVHGITTEHAHAHGESPEQAIRTIMRILTLNHPIVVYNARYDLTVMFHEMARHGIHHSLHEIGLLTVIDPLVIDKHVDKYRRGSRKLLDTAAHYGIVLENAHDAEADALAAALIARELAKRHPAEFESLNSLHYSQVKWASEQAESLERHFHSRGKTDAKVERRWPYYTEVTL